MRDPFKPSFGVSPPLLVGRQDLLDTFADGIDAGPGALSRASLYTGQRGSGKTVLLNAIEHDAESRGWVVIDDTASPGFVRRIMDEHLPKLLAEFDPRALRSHLASFSLPGGLGASWTTEELHRAVPGLRNQLTLLTDLLAEHETGVLITLDEIQLGDASELRELATTIQHLFREEREIAFAGAGLPASVSDLLQDEVLTFLRRADRYELGALADSDVRRALAQPIEVNGRTVDEDVLDVLAAATGRYPFLIQLVGSSAWREHSDVVAISMDDAIRGVEAARRRMGSLVHEPALKGITDVSKTFLVAMAKDDGPSKVSVIQERMGVGPNYASQYRLKLIAAGLVQRAGWGRVEFSLPYLRDFIREHVVSGL